MQKTEAVQPSVPSEGAGVNPRVRDLLREAAAWRLLGRLFECPDEDWRYDIVALAREVDDPELRPAAELALAIATEGQYHSVFGPGGPAPPREASYHDTLELGSLMSELTGSYSAFGYRASTHEPLDHVAVELGFLSYLRLKEAYALFEGQSEHAAITAEAAERLRTDHLAVIAAPLAAALAQSGIDYLARASAALAARVGPPPARATLRVIQPSEDEEGSQFSCSQ